MCHKTRGSTRQHCKFFRDTNGISCSETRNFSDLTPLFGVSVSDEVKLYTCHRILLCKMTIHSMAQSHSTIFIRHDVLYFQKATCFDPNGS